MSEPPLRDDELRVLRGMLDEHRQRLAREARRSGLVRDWKLVLTGLAAAVATAQTIAGAVTHGRW